MTDRIEVATYGRNSDIRQQTSQGIQADIFQQFVDDGFQLLYGKQAVITENYKDDGKSASKKKSKRNDFDRMLEDIQLGKHKIILVLNTSRFSRLHPVDTLEFMRILRNNNAQLVSIEDRKIVGIDDLGELITNIVKFSSDHEYARSLAANVLRGTVRKIKNEATCHVATIPYGLNKLVITDNGEERVYQRTDNIRLPETWKGYLVGGEPTEQGIVRWIFQTYLEADISFCEIARQLNNHDNPAVRAGCRGKGWDGTWIKRMLSNRHYRGQEFVGMKQAGEHYRTINGQVVAAKQAAMMESTPLIVEGKHHDKYPPVVKPEVFEQAQQKLRRKTGSKPKTLTTDGYCLTSSLVCGHCGYNMITKGGGLFICKSGKSGKTACKQWSVNEKEVLPWLVHRIDKEVLRRLQEKPEVSPSPDTTIIRQQIETIDAKIGNITIQLTDAATTVETCHTLTTAIAALGTEKERLQSRLHDDNYQHRLEVATDRWVELVKPYLVSLKTGNLGEDNPAVRHLDLQDEVDRLFNFTDAKPSKVRELLQGMETKVVCHFTDKPPTNPRRKGERRHYQLDHGGVTITMNGINSHLSEGDIQHSARRDGTQLTGQMAAPFGIVVPFRVCSHATVRETA